MILLLGLLAACGSEPEVRLLAPDARVLAFGDSLTHGTGAADEESYPAVLSAMIGREIINAGVPGEETGEGLERLPRLLDEVRPNLLILCHGGNDILRGRNLERAAENLSAMIAMARERDIDVVLIGVPDRGLPRGVADFYSDVAERENVPLENGVIARILRSPSLKSDAVHPNGDGYRELATAVHELLADAGAIID